MIITITGNAGSGKSTVSKLLAKKLHYRHYSAGDLQRVIARKLGMTIGELGRHESKDDKLDRMIDKKTAELGKTKDNFVIDGWLAAHFIPKAFKVFLTVSLDEAVRRRLKHKRKEEHYQTASEVKTALREREAVNRRRWKRYYHFDYAKRSNYNLIINTTKKTPKQVVSSIMAALKKKSI